MPTKQISNPAGLFGLGADWNDSDYTTVKNLATGATRTVGDVVVWSLPVNSTTYYVPNVTTTTSAGSLYFAGVVVDPTYEGPDNASSLSPAAGSSGKTYAAGAEMPVVNKGVQRINIGSNTVTAADILTTSTGAGVAVTNNSATTGQGIAIALEASTAKDANNTIRAIIGRF